MQTQLDSGFATPREIAKVLGVPISRMKKLVKLAQSSIKGHGKKAANGLSDKATSPVAYFKNVSTKRKAGRKSASRKRYARGKASKARR
jgi:hypothetical protein